MAGAERKGALSRWLGIGKPERSVDSPRTILDKQSKVLVEIGCARQRGLDSRDYSYYLSSFVSPLSSENGIRPVVVDPAALLCAVESGKIKVFGPNGTPINDLTLFVPPSHPYTIHPNVKKEFDPNDRGLTVIEGVSHFLQEPEIITKTNKVFLAGSTDQKTGTTPFLTKSAIGPVVAYDEARDFRYHGFAIDGGINFRLAA